MSDAAHFMAAEENSAPPTPLERLAQDQSRGHEKSGWNDAAVKSVLIYT
jgi:hypothetical protein